MEKDQVVTVEGQPYPVRIIDARPHDTFFFGTWTREATGGDSATAIVLRVFEKNKIRYPEKPKAKPGVMYRTDHNQRWIGLADGRVIGRLSGAIYPFEQLKRSFGSVCEVVPE